MKANIFTALSLLLISSAFAHEGHDKTPGTIAAPHGGLIQGTSSLYWELVNEAGGVKLYPLTHETSPIAPQEISLSGTAAFPKKTKREPVKFTVESDHFTAKIDAKGAYRYSLDLVSKYKGKSEKIKFQVEPQN